MSITEIPCRACVTIGSLEVRTPYVLSFTVRKVRGQISTCEVALKVKDVSSIGGGSFMQISAGVGGCSLIWSGIVTQGKIEACHDDPGYMILSVSGKDVLMLLESKKFTRRCRATQGPFATINSVVRKGLKSGKWANEVGALVTDNGTPKNLLGTSTIPLTLPIGAKVNSTGTLPSPQIKVSVKG